MPTRPVPDIDAIAESITDEPVAYLVERWDDTPNPSRMGGMPSALKNRGASYFPTDPSKHKTGREAAAISDRTGYEVRWMTNSDKNDIIGMIRNAGDERDDKQIEKSLLRFLKPLNHIGMVAIQPDYENGDGRVLGYVGYATTKNAIVIRQIVASPEVDKNEIIKALVGSILNKTDKGRKQRVFVRTPEDMPVDVQKLFASFGMEARPGPMPGVISFVWHKMPGDDDDWNLPERSGRNDKVIDLDDLD